MTDSTGAVRLTIDGVPCEAAPLETILSVATRTGLTIPGLCNDPRLPPDPSCWVCIVEVTRDGAPRLEPACSTRVAHGMAVRTSTGDVERSRRWALELLLSDHYADCVAPCIDACPAHVDIPRYVAAVAAGEHAKAVGIIAERNPLPTVCGRVCPHPCEAACRRGLLEAPVAINELKRLASDTCLGREAAGRVEARPESGKRVAVVGAGPAGLTAATYLRLEGHGVTVFDAMEEPGGMLRYGIPDFRLPRDVLDADIGNVLRLGVALRQGTRLGRDFTVASLLANGFDAVFLAIGAWMSQRMGIVGDDAEGVLAGVPFLNQVNQGTLSSLHGDVVVIGGGNTAIDAARAAVRLGAARVTMAYRRDRAQMPAFTHEVDAALAEGVVLRCLLAPVSVVVREGRVAGLLVQQMALGEPDASGRPRPVPLAGTEHVIEAAHVIAALGEKPDRLEDEPEVPGPLHEVDAATLVTSHPRVFAGDFVSGPGTAIGAIAAGRRAAVAIDGALREGRPTHPRARITSRRDALSHPHAADYRHVRPGARAASVERPPEARACDFAEAAATLPEAAGRAEAARCMQCGCPAYDRCALRPLIDEYGADQRRVAGEHHRFPPEEVRPGLVLEMNRCIRCARCVRVCRDVVGVGAFDFVGRGFDVRLLFALSDEAARGRCDVCLAAGAPCAETCPTGALLLPGPGGTP